MSSDWLDTVNGSLDWSITEIDVTKSKSWIAGKLSNPESTALHIRLVRGYLSGSLQTSIEKLSLSYCDGKIKSDLCAVTFHKQVR